MADLSREFGGRLNRIQRALDENDLEGILAYSDEWREGHVKYVTNFRPLTFNADGTIYTGALVNVPRQGEPTLFVGSESQLYVARDDSVVKDARTIKGDLKSFLNEHYKKSAKIGLVGLDIMPYQIHEMIRESLPEAKFEPSTILNQVREIKSPWEVEMIEKAANITDQGILAGVHAVKEGVTEKEISNAIIRAFLDAQSEVVFGPEVGVGPRSGQEDSWPTNTKVASGDYVLIDSGARWQGYCGDLTRGVACGSIPKKHRDVVQIVIEGWKKALANANVGAKLADIISSSFAVVKEAGYGEFPHEVVHGVGLDVEEYPFVESTVIKPNMVFVVECAVYLDKEMGLRLEDAVVATDSGPRKLNKLDPEYNV